MDASPSAPLLVLCFLRPMHFCAWPVAAYESSTVAILGSKQQVGRRQTMRTPLALWGPTFIKVAITDVSPPRPSGPMLASLTLWVISRSISDWTSYLPSTWAWSIMEAASKWLRPTPTASVQGEQPSCATLSFAQLTISSSTTWVLCLWNTR